MNPTEEILAKGKILKKKIKRKENRTNSENGKHPIQRKRGTQTDVRYQDPTEMTLDCG